MQKLEKTIHFLTAITKYIALATLTLMMVFITFAVISRLLSSPIIGDIEIVQLGMVVLIMCGLAYTEQVNGHITIDIFSSKLSLKWQRILEIIGAFLTFLVTLLIAYIYLHVGLFHQFTMPISTTLLEIPFYPFDYIITFGFLMWGAEAFLRLLKLILGFSSENIGGDEHAG